ncbi:MAG TPA: DNA alkylation repair protein [Anaerolineales bacterium]|jgi:3-methyladenine DNA glycosylase AlkD|nr:DNA alkylation repair protein [Anaerolineales bacterium]
MHPYVSSLKTLLEQHADLTQAAPMKKYMRDQFEYLGVKSPQVKALFRQAVKENGLPSPEGLDQIVRELWELPQREFQYLAISLMERLEKNLPSNIIKTLEYMITYKSWWDTVDNISHIVGIHFKRYPEVREKYLPKWRASDNLWLRRTAILFQLDYKEETNFDLLQEIIQENLGSTEFFINKAIGWALRQYARIDPNAVKKFVKSTALHPLSRREAMKHLEA